MKNILLALLIIAQFPVEAQNLQFQSRTTYDQALSDVWGWSDGVNEYAIVGYRTGFSIVDVTEPQFPVKLHEISGPQTIWRDIKTYGNYAYGIHENVGMNGQGLVIMDLSGLPLSVGVSNWHTDGSPGVYLRDAHNLYIDEQGVAYIVGNNVGEGVLMLDLTVDPENPVVLGQYTDNYVHDCFARNDTLWTAEVDAGEFAVISIATKSDPETLARQETPLSFTHNIWISDDGKTAFTTDERSNGTIAAYDVSDLSDIKWLDNYRSNPQVIPHNVTVVNDFVVASMYRDGIIILDASFPDELVEIGRYDTSPSLSGDGFNGSWGVYPYLPSGNILASDIERGLFVLTPNYQKAVHIRGTVRNASTGEELRSVIVEITGAGTNNLRATNLEGKFKIGLVNSGNYTVKFTKEGFQPILKTTSLSPGDAEIFDLEMDPVTLSASDTIYAEVNAGASIEICANSGGVETDLAYTCNYDDSSEFGEWVTDDNCLSYTAGAATGEFIDSICFVLTDSETDANFVSLVVVSISGISTGTGNIPLMNSGWTLEQNPVRDRFSISRQQVTTTDAVLKIFDVNGQQLNNTRVPAGSNRADVLVSGLNSGWYIATLNMPGSPQGYLKFVKY